MKSKKRKREANFVDRSKRKKEEEERRKGSLCALERMRRCRNQHQRSTGKAKEAVPDVLEIPQELDGTVEERGRGPDRQAHTVSTGDGHTPPFSQRGPPIQSYLARRTALTT